jgi:hypothetical protein
LSDDDGSLWPARALRSWQMIFSSIRHGQKICIRVDARWYVDVKWGEVRKLPR